MHGTINLLHPYFLAQIPQILQILDILFIITIIIKLIIKIYNYYLSKIMQKCSIQQSNINSLIHISLI